jgi:ATP-dependent helicase/nuclease subunit B
VVGRLVSAPRSELRLREAAGWLATRPVGEEVLVVAATGAAADEQVRAVAAARGTAFGLHRFTLGRLAAELAKLELAAHDLASVGALPIEALCARVVHLLRVSGQLGRLEAVADQPGLPRALARTLTELRMAGATSVEGHPELTAAMAALTEALDTARLADRALIYRIATRMVEKAAASQPLLGRHLLLVDVPTRSVVEQRLLAALISQARSVLATVPSGDDRTIRYLREIVAVDVEALGGLADADSLQRVQRYLFTRGSPKATLDDTVSIFSAPGESRECVEIARRIVREAELGIPFDRMVVLLRAPDRYRVHLEEALGRAGVPAHFDQGTVLPDPSGRAFLALLGSATEGLSARRFAEYVSLGEVPAAEDGGGPPPPVPAGDRWIPPDEELLPSALATTTDGEAASEDASSIDTAVPGGTLRAPWRWERLLVEAAVIGGRERWTRRLDGLDARLRLDDGEDGRENRTRMLQDLGHLRRFALPLLDDLAALPHHALWGEWLDRLSALATRALRRPERVLAVLAALAPMNDVGPVDLREVELVLHSRLTELIVPPKGRRHGRVLVAPIDAARGLAFDVVFVPGLAERMFPQKIGEDPLLLDDERLRLGLGLEDRDDRVAEERLALRLAVGAARRRLVLSFPRIDLEQGRPRVPSFYGLEVLEAAEGALPGFDELARRADVTGAARIGWPAPANPIDAIDEAEHDLALLDGLFRSTAPAPTGAAHYLLATNPHLARALRSRARRWEVSAWKPADGFIVSTPEARVALAAHAPSVRSFSPTALEQLSACPLRFAFRTIVRLEPRELPEPIEALGALERGSLVHEVQFELLGELRTASQLPVRPENLDAARSRLDDALDRVAARYRDELFPAIDRVWNDGIASIRADLREWLRRMAEDLEWMPRRFELAFGLEGREGRDPASVDEPVELEIGLALRGSIDLVEQSTGGALRATDHKTGKARVERGAVIAGGKSLQPVLYALVLEKLFPGSVVAGGRLDYCTTRGDFQEVMVPLHGDARSAARVVAETLAYHVEQGFFPAAPAKDECKYCDFRPICGPYEERRTKRKQREPLAQLQRLRETP